MTAARWIVPVLAFGLLVGCRDVVLESSWRAKRITIDGRDGEWGEKYFFKKEGAIVGVANDETHLYLFLSTTDRNLQVKLLRQGFTASFDPGGGKKTHFGVYYPLGLSADDVWLLAESLRGGRELSASTVPGAGPQINPEMVEAMYAAVMEEGKMEILGGSARDRWVVPVAEVPEMEVALAYAENKLVYELKVPLAQIEREKYRVGIGATEVKPVGIGLLTPELDMRRLQRDRDPRVGGLGMRGGGYGGDGRRQGVEIFREVTQPLQLWAKVSLAER